MGIKNPVEAAVGILMLLDEIREKMAGTKIADVQWRPELPGSADLVDELTRDAFAQCDDVTEALVVMTVACVVVSLNERAIS